MNIVNTPSLPFWGHIPGGVQPGTIIQIDGHIHHHCSKFEVSLFCGNDVGHHAEKHSNVALQIRPKIHGKKVICNSRQYGSWGHKEKHRNFHHVSHGHTFNMQIIAEHQHYRILINGQTTCMFHHRIPIHEVRVLNIEGHIDVHRIEYRNQYGVQPTAPVYPSAPPPYVPQPGYPSSRPGPPYPSSGTVYPPSGAVYPPSGAVYPPSGTVYPPSATVYPAPPPPVYISPPVVQPAYVPQTVIVEDHHHHGHHHGLGHVIEDIFGHDHHHRHHHHGHHHHGHHW